jgi:hypothetical protein
MAVLKTNLHIMKQFLSFAVLLIFITGCSEPSYYGPNTAGGQMDYLGLKIELAESSYDMYIALQETMPGQQSMYDIMVESFATELQGAKDSRSYDNPDEYIQPNDGLALKEAAINIIETYISVAETELTQVKDERLRWLSDRCQWYYEGGNIRIQEAYEAYGVIQQKIADEHGIRLY